MFSSNLEQWAKENVLKLLSLDEESALLVAQTAAAAQNAGEAKNHWISLLGESPEAIEFVSEFNRRRFAPSSKKDTSYKKADIDRPSEKASNSSSEKSTVYPTISQQQKTRQTRSSSSDRDKSKNTKTNDDLYNIPKVAQKTTSQGTLTSDLMGTKKAFKPKQVPQVSKIDGLADIERAIHQVEISQKSSNSNRRSCDCQGRKHPLNEAAPNCLNCGKIICMLEGMGPCTFCKAPVISKTQQLELLQELKKAGSDIKQAANQKTKSKHSSSKHQFQKLNNSSIHSIFIDPKQLEQKAIEAEQRKNVLLNFDRTAAQRTKIIDEAADFDPTTLASDTWASPAEKALNLVKMQQALSQKEKKKKKVLSISLSGKKVVVDQKDESSDEEVPDNEHHNFLETKELEASAKQNSSNITRIPRSLARPVFRPQNLPKKSELPKEITEKINRSWSKVQDAIEND
ncbi:thyroid receptor interacting protein-like protein, transcription coactivator [Schizosaccharomyces osmophilus]|uniref:Thyroid receptor interacting protein-like protein, transcription coactivator n=1 Tax=Schizosaccharomyces osmophilus TaxID=2545709 RepID=A0AAE9W8E3_9SCHI|nr:thyroid receptor interacting protein-like protein, transcription coactivator [Schizosaccharomyces osmophilus]WBW70752.1 thyroid receptor interacting protein-like protein, transcription coactivator [Schizosaccharomyces osmophilus]